MKSKSKPRKSSLQWLRIRVPVDFSAPSVLASRYARALAIQHSASLTVLHVVEPFHADMLMDTTDILRERRRQTVKQLRALVAREITGGVKAKAKLRAGHPVEAITRFAREARADLIVRHAPCPVLVVQKQEALSQPPHA